VEPRTNLATRPGAWAMAADAGGGKLTILNLTETRPTQGSGQIAVMLELVDPALGPLASLRRVTFTRAVDDRNINLLPAPSVATGPAATAAAGNPGLAAIMNASAPAAAAAPAGRGGRGGGGAAAVVPPGTRRATVNLTVGRRDATVVKVLDGELEVLAPAAGNGSLLVFKDLPALRGKPLAHPILAREGIEIILVDAASASVLNDRNFAAARGGQPGPPAVEGTAVFVRDPSGRLAGFFVQDAAGRTLPVAAPALRSTTTGDTLFDLRPAQPLPPDAQLVLHLAIPEAIRRTPFRFDNIPLP
jgi:hypothetical protein